MTLEQLNKYRGQGVNLPLPPPIPLEAEIVSVEPQNELHELNDELYEHFCATVRLLEACRELLNYAADPELMKTIKKQDRATMEKLSEEIREQLVVLFATYGEELCGS